MRNKLFEFFGTIAFWVDPKKWFLHLRTSAHFEKNANFMNRKYKFQSILVFLQKGKKDFRVPAEIR